MSHNNTEKEGYKKTTLGWIPNEWEVKKTKELGEISSGGTPDTSQMIYWNGSINWCTPTDITALNGNKYLNSTTTKITDAGLKNSSAKVLPINSLIVCTRASIGKVVINKIEMSTNQGFKNIIPKNIIADFLYYKLSNETIGLLRIANGSTFLEVSKTDFENYNLSIPPIDEQKKIAAILSTWDEAITKTQNLITQLQLRNKGLMLQLLKPKESWKKFRMGDLIEEIKRPVEWNDNECYDLISVRRRSGGAFFRESLKGEQILTKQLLTVYENDFLFSKMQIVHGASSIVPKELSGMKVSGSYITVKAKDETKLDIQYFNWLSKSRFFYRLTFLSSHGVHIEKMTFDFDDFKRHKISLPNLLSDQKRTVQILNKGVDEVKKLEQKLAALQLQKKGLMQKLLMGEVRVKVKSEK